MKQKKLQKCQIIQTFYAFEIDSTKGNWAYPINYTKGIVNSQLPDEKYVRITAGYMH